jgi:CBS domain-containing protein
MQCHEIMTCNVEHVTPELSVELAARKMFERILGILPVCNGQGQVVGVVTDRDIVLRVCAVGRVPQQTRVEEIMSSPVVACRPYDPVARAERLMILHHKARILVTSEQAELLGIISLTDLAQHEEPLQAARVLRDITARAFRFEGPRKLHTVPPPDPPSSGQRSRRRSKVSAN